MQDAALPSISVAMATYNGAQFIAAQIASLLNQTFPPCEVIVSDDNSTDDTIKIVRDIASRAQIPIVVSSNTIRLGYRANFMQAAALCSGDLISFCDQDDVWHREKLRSVAQCFVDNDILMAFHNAEVVDQLGKSLGRFLFHVEQPSHIINRLGTSPWSYPLGFTQTFRRELLKLSPLRLTTEDPYSATESLAHDQWIPLIAIALGETAYIGDILANYRQHQNNLFGKPHVKKSKHRMLAEKFFKHCDYDRLSRVSLKIAQMFEVVQTNQSAGIAQKAAEAKDRYFRLSNYYAMRSKIYEGTRLFTRAKEWSKMMRLGAYAKGQPIAFLGTSFAKDFLAGVLLGCLKSTRLRSEYRTDHDASVSFGHVK